MMTFNFKEFATMLPASYTAIHDLISEKEAVLQKLRSNLEAAIGAKCKGETLVAISEAVKVLEDEIAEMWKSLEVK